MKPAVVEPNGVVRRTLGLVQDGFVVQAELALWCAREIGPHEDLAIDIGSEDGACCETGVRLGEGKTKESMPFALIRRLTFSTTSTNASFFLYFTSPLRQLIAPVICDVSFELSPICCDRTLGGVLHEG